MNTEISQFFIQFYRSNKLLTDSIETFCRSYNINHIQLYIIVLSSCKKMNVSMLAETLGVSKSAISQAITGLMLRRIVTKRLSKEDRKIYFIKPTVKGEKIKEEILNLCEVQYFTLRDKMAEDMDEFIRLIVKLNKIIEEMKLDKEEKNA